MTFHIFSIAKESIIDVQAYVRKTEMKVESCSQQDVELHCVQVRTGLSFTENILILMVKYNMNGIRVKTLCEEGRNHSWLCD